MQTARIKINTVYAIHLGQELVRFAVDEIVTTKSSDRSESKIVGWIIKDGTRDRKLSLDPTDVIGPYEEQAALVEQQKREEEQRKIAAEARERQARADRKALYKFVGAEMPRNEKDYHQLFRMNYGGVDISSEGKAELIKKIRELSGATTPDRKVTSEV